MIDLTPHGVSFALLQGQLLAARGYQLETWARGPMVINQRIDHFKDFQIKAWNGTGVFFLKNGRIVEWFDYTTFTDPAWS